MDKRDLEQFIHNVKRFPSGDNCQPWLFTILSENSIKITYAPQRDEHELNKNGSVKLIGKGFLLYYIEESAKALGHEINIVDEEQTIIVEFTNSSPDLQQKEKLVSLQERRCDRRYYDQSLNEQDKHMLSQLGCNLICSYIDLPRSVLNHIKMSERTFWTSPKILASFMKWLHLSKKEYETEKDGLAYYQVGIKFFEIPIFYFFKKFTKISSLLFKTPVYYSIESKLRLFYKNSTLIIYTFENNRPSYVNNKSKEILDDWCKIQSHGLSYQPMNISSLPYYDKTLSTNKDEQTMGREKLDFLKKELNLEHDPIWIARVGRCSRPYKIPPTLRR